MILYKRITQSTNPYKIQESCQRKRLWRTKHSLPIQYFLFFAPFQALIRFFFMIDERFYLCLLVPLFFFFFFFSFRPQSLFLCNFLPVLFIHAFNLRVVLCRRHPNHTKQNFPPSSSIRCRLHNKQHEVHINVTAKGGGWYNFPQLSRRFLYKRTAHRV
jgi:hypothetical protein